MECELQSDPLNLLLPPIPHPTPPQLFETVKGMPAFMLNNGLLKVICQLISIVTDYGQLSIEEKELILNDVLQLCKLVVIFAIRSDQ